MPQNTLFNPLHFSEYTKAKLNKAGKGVSATVTAGQTVNIDHTLADDMCVSGAIVLISGAVQGDKIDMQVVAGETVLITLLADWFVDYSVLRQEPPTTGYPAKLPTGLTLRMKYYSTGQNNVWIAINYNLEKILG